MQFKLQLIVDDDNGDTTTEDIIVLDKSTSAQSLVGLSLLESKQILKRL